MAATLDRCEHGHMSGANPEHIPQPPVDDLSQGSNLTRQHPEFDRLIGTIAALRQDPGCVWYQAQTHETLVPYLVEESAELVEALETGTAEDRVEELGDVLFQVLFHADYAEHRPEAGERFTLDDVAKALREKLERRNPHVFGDKPTRDMDEIIRMWNDAKAEEKRDRESAFDGIPASLSGSARAVKAISTAKKVSPETDAVDLVESLIPEPDVPGEDLVGRALLLSFASLIEAGYDPERVLRDAARMLENGARQLEREKRQREEG